MLKTVIIWLLILLLIFCIVFTIFGATFEMKPEHIYIPTTKNQGFDKKCDQEVVYCNKDEDCANTCQAIEGIEIECSLLKRVGDYCKYTNEADCVSPKKGGPNCKWQKVERQDTYKAGQNPIGGKCVPKYSCDYKQSSSPHPSPHPSAQEKCVQDIHCKWDVQSSTCLSISQNSNRLGVTKKICQPKYPKTSCNTKNGGVYTWTGWTGIDVGEWDCMCTYPFLAGANGSCETNYGVCEGGTFNIDINETGNTFDANACDCGQNKMLLSSSNGLKPVCVKKQSYLCDNSIPADSVNPVDLHRACPGKRLCMTMFGDVVDDYNVGDDRDPKTKKPYTEGCDPLITYKSSA
jgi:hypothetical protein